MTEYITKEQAIHAMEQVTQPECFIEDTRKGFARIIEELPPADVEPVIYAKWKFVVGPNEDNNIQFMCDNCGAGDVHAVGVTVPYCWRCGARMDGGESDA